MTVHEQPIEKCLISPRSDVCPQYKEVIIIGNGPSAMNLSFILSGQRPFYQGKGLEATNEMLHYKLIQNLNQHIFEQDLAFLSEGLEGQVSNKMALLFDKLTNPGADVGLFSQSALTWRRNGEAPIDHVVLGRGKVGGTWQTMDRSMKTLSQAFLLQMPSMPIEKWLLKYRAENEKKSANETKNEATNISNEHSANKNRPNIFKNVPKPRNIEKSSASSSISSSSSDGGGPSSSSISSGGGSSSREGGGKMQGRVSVDEMCAYFEEFVEAKGLSNYFRNEHLVVGVRKVTCGGGRGNDSSGRVTCRGGGGGLRDSGCEDGSLVNAGDDDDEDGDIGNDDVDNDANSGSGDYDLAAKKKRIGTNDDSSSIKSLSDNTGDNDVIVDDKDDGNGDDDDDDGDDDDCNSSGMDSCEDGCQGDCGADNDASGEEEEGKAVMWEVYGSNSEGEQFCYRAPHLVLATGGSDRPNRLGVRGESLSGIGHSQAEFHAHVKALSRKDCWGCRLGRRLFRLVDRSPVSPINEHPAVIIGSGLSAADAVLYALEKGIPVVHMFEKSIEEASRTYRYLSALLYPEYCRVFDLMSQKVLLPGLYQSMPAVRILSFLDQKQILVQECDKTTPTTIRASIVSILIGSSPCLSFLPDPILATLFSPPSPGSHRQLVAVDGSSYQSHNHSGLYAMGPLVGENYVRFLGGGAFAISSHIIKNLRSSSSS